MIKTHDELQKKDAVYKLFLGNWYFLAGRNWKYDLNYKTWQNFISL